MDAAEYKHVFWGPMSLKYISDVCDKMNVHLEVLLQTKTLPPRETLNIYQYLVVDQFEIQKSIQALLSA